MLGDWQNLDPNKTPPAYPEPIEPAFMVSRKEWIKVLRRFKRANMCDLLELCDVARDPQGCALIAGAFAVTKKGGRLRLIVDRRPWNQWERSLKGLVLPHGVLFSKLVLEPDEVIRLSLRDVQNFYYVLRVPDQRVPYQGVGPAVSRAWWAEGCPDWGMGDIFPPEGADVYSVPDHGLWGQPALTVVLMGDLNGVTVAQETHRNIGLRQHVFKPSEELQLGRPTPRGRTWVGTYIDDFLTTERARLRELCKGGSLRDQIIMKRADDVGEELGLLENKHKRQRNLLGGRAWGTTLDMATDKDGDPEQHILGPSAGPGKDRVLDLIRITWAIAAVAVITKNTMQRVLGHWSSLLIFRRVLYAILEKTYRWVERMPDEEMVFMPSYVLCELFMLTFF